MKLCEELTNIYDVCGKQLYRLRDAWSKFSKEKGLKSKG